MSEAPPDPERSGRRRRATRKRRPSLRQVLGACALLVLVLVGAAAWMGIRGASAKDHLQSARAETDTLRAALLDGDTAAAKTSLAKVQSDTARAHALTSDPVWRAAGAMPLAGRSADAVTTTTAAVDQVAQQVLPVLVDQSDALAPSKVRVAGNRFDLARIEAAAPSLAAAKQQAVAAAARANAVDTNGLPAGLRAAVVKAQAGLDDLANLTTNASDAATLMPSMLGADGPRRYFVGFQSNAELRGSGGLLGAYAVLEADKGKVRLTELGPRSELDPGNLKKPAVDLGADFEALYGDDPALWANANESAHFPYTAQLWLAMYEKQRGVKLDGAIATDPVALGQLLGATGPATLHDGTQVTASNAASLTMKDVYKNIPTDDAKRDAYLQDVARAVFTNLLEGKGGADNLAHALGRSAGERRLLVYSTEPAEQAVLATTPLAGSVAATPGPSLGVFANSGSASKLDYYVDASVDYALGTCTTGGRRDSKVQVSWASTAPTSGLTSYVTGPRGPGGTVSNLDLMTVHLPVGSTVTRATIDGKALGISPHTLLGRPVVTFPVRTDAGASHAVVLELSEPRSPVAPTVQVQALASPARVSVDPGPDCS